MNRLCWSFLALFSWAPLYAQHLSAEIVNLESVVHSAHLDPPHTAGGEFASEILLESKAVLSLIDLAPNVQWCLSVHQGQSYAGLAPLKIHIDYSTLTPEQWGGNMPHDIVLSTSPVQVFFGIGPVEGLEVLFSLKDAQISKDWAPRDEVLIWTVESGGCTR